MDNRIKLFLIGFGFLIGSGALAMQIGGGNWFAAALVCLAVIAVGVVLMIGGDSPFDGSVYALLVGAIWVTGKGAVYLGLGNLVYISEIVLAMLLLGYVMRCSTKQWPLLPPTSLAFPVTLFLLYGVLHIWVDIRTFGFMTLRDSCIVYYSGFFLAAYQLANTSEAFTRLLKKILLFAAVLTFGLAAIQSLGGAVIVSSLRLLLTFGSRSLFAPHPDSSDAVVLGVIVFCVFMTKSRAGYAWIFQFVCLLGVLIVLANVKGALLVGFFTALGYLFLAGQYWFFRRLAFVGLLGAVVVFAAVEYYPEYTPDQLDKVVEEFESMVSPFREKTKSDESTDDKTVAWRLGWWSWIIRETFATNPFWGMGLGRDLAIEFEEEYFGRRYIAEQSAVRGAHSSMMTIFGRMGLIGLVFFLWITTLQAWYMFRAALWAKKLGGQAPIELTLYPGYLCGMVGSTFFQYGWDAPYSAIPLWTCLALMVWRVTDLDAKFAREEKPNSLSQPPVWRNRPLLAGAAADG